MTAAAGALQKRYDSKVVSKMRNSLIKIEQAGGGAKERNLAGGAPYASVTRGDCSVID